MKKAHIIVIGNEILSGSTLDTNSKFIASQLKNIGILVSKISTIPDELPVIIEYLKQSSSYDVVITTGGLGPTNDDKTKEAWSCFFDKKLVMNAEVLEHLTQYLTQKGRLEILERNKEQALVLEDCKVLQNDYGTAPCMLMQHQKTCFFSLPGVPYEVKPLVKDKIIPFLKEKWVLPHQLTRVVSVVNIPESVLAEKLTDWENQLPKAISLAYLPIGTRVKLSLSISGHNKTDLDYILETEILKLNALIKDNIIAKNQDKIEEILSEILTQNQLTISTAESCTAGKIASLIASVPGSSAYFKGGIIPYQSQIKQRLLGVDADILKTHSVVSEAVVLDMAKKCQKLFDTDIAIATTGVAGPGKGEDDAEIGQLFIGIVTPQKQDVFHLKIPHMDRMDFIAFSSQKAIENLITMLTQVS